MTLRSSGIHASPVYLASSAATGATIVEATPSANRVARRQDYRDAASSLVVLRHDGVPQETSAAIQAVGGMRGDALYHSRCQ